MIVLPVTEKPCHQWSVAHLPFYASIKSQETSSWGNPSHAENYGQLRNPQYDGKIWNIKQHKSISTFHYLQEPSQLENPVKRKLKDMFFQGLGDPGKANKINISTVLISELPADTWLRNGKLPGCFISPLLKGKCQLYQAVFLSNVPVANANL